MLDDRLVNFPRLIFVICFILLGISVFVGDYLRRLRPVEEGRREDFSVVQGATLTLLGLLIGFTFSMAVGRYDQRKDYEEAEANAIGTEYVRAQLLPVSDTEKLQDLLKQYVDQRILFYTAQRGQQLGQINERTSQLQSQLWSVVQSRAAVQQNPMIALAVSGMNDVLNSQGYTQAAWWNRIPRSAWALLAAIAVVSNLLIGYGAHRRSILLFTIVPLTVSVSFFLVADIDSPRRGMIRVQPENLMALRQTMR